MTPSLQPQRISVFMPQRMSTNEIETLFVVRQEILENLLRSLNDESPNSIPQHHLLIGQRGMGKTTLLIRLDIELHKPTYRSRFIPFTFPEEQYNIDRLSKFWLNSLDALADTLQTEGDFTSAFQLDDRITNLSSIRDENQLSRKSYELLKQTTQNLGRRPVFLLDNLNLIFERLGEMEQSTLRKLISEPGAPIFIGASATPIDNNLEYNAPFYDAFDVHYLNRLDFNQMLLMLKHLAFITNQKGLQEQILNGNTARLETLHALTGGNVRTVVILFSLVSQGFSADVFQDLEALIDQMTPFYKARFEELSKQQQVVVDAIALNWDPANLETLREKTILENNQLSVQLDRLLKSGWISKLGKRKTANYEISERFFNVWYLMRRSSRRQRRDLLWLTRFLQVWFTKIELIKQTKEYSRKVADKCHPYEISFGLALARAIDNEKESKKLLEKSYKRLIELYDGDNSSIEKIVGVDLIELNKDWLIEYKDAKERKLLEDAFNFIRSKEYVEAESYFKRILENNETFLYAWVGLGDLYRIGFERYPESEQAYHKAIEIDKTFAYTWKGLGDLYRTDLERYPEAEQAYRKAIEIDEKLILAWLGLGDLYRIDLERYPEAEQAYRKAIEIDDTFTYAWGSLGDLYRINLKRYPEAEQAYCKVVEIDAKSIQAWMGLGDLYRISLERYSEAEQAYHKAIEIDKKYAHAWRCLGDLYRIDLKRYPEAEQAYRKAIEIDENYTYAWIGIGKLYSCDLEKYKEAEKACKRAIEISNDNADAWFSLGHLYHVHLNRYSEAEQAYRKAVEIDENYIQAWDSLGDLYQAGLEQYSEAEQAYRKAIEIDENYAFGWKGLGDLYRINLERYSEAEQAYRKAIEIDENYAYAWAGLGDLYRIDLEQYTEAEQAYRKAIEINKKYAYAWAGLGDLYRIDLGRYPEAEQAYHKAIEIDESFIYAWVGLGDLYRIGFERYSEAEQAYRKTIEIDETFAYAWKGLGDLYRINLERYFEAEQAYRKAIEIDESYAYAWKGLGDLYRIDLKRYSEAEQAYRKAIEIDEDYAYAWGALGNILIDNTTDYKEAEQALRRAIALDNSIVHKANLVFLLRDQLNDVEAASNLFDISQPDYISENLLDAAELHKASFALYNRNWEDAKKYWKSALNNINENMPSHTKDDWYRSAAVAVRLGFGKNLLILFEETGYNRIFRPLFEAIKALTIDSEDYLKNDVAAELRDIALQIFQFMKNYNKIGKYQSEVKLSER